MFTSDAQGRLAPVGLSSMHQLDRLTYQALQEDILELARLTENGAVAITPHITNWVKGNGGSSGGGNSGAKAHHSSDERAGTQAPIGFASDGVPVFETHECQAGTCARPFPPLFIEAAIQRYSWSGSGLNEITALERHQSALILSDLFIAQCAQLLHSLRFHGGRDLFAQSFLCEIDEMMRGALWRGEAKGKKAADELLGLEGESHQLTSSGRDPSASPRESPREATRIPNYDRAATVTTTSSSSASAQSSSGGSTASLNVSLDPRRSRRSSQDSLVHHPFAPAAYENVMSNDGPQTARVIGGARVGGSRRIVSTTSTIQRPRQCLMSSLLALLRFANGLGVRLKYWRNQLKAKQSEIVRLTILAEAAKQAEPISAPATSDPASAKEIALLQTKIITLETQIATALATISEYEASGRTRQKYQPPEFGDTTIPWGQKQSGSSNSEDGPLAGQLASLQLALESARQENLTLIRECNDRVSEQTALRDAQHQTLDSLRAELAAMKSESRTREEALAAVQSLADERELKINQLNAMLTAIKERVTSREREWEGKEESWKKGQPGRLDDTDAAAAAAAAHAKKEAEWFASQQARDEMEAQLQAAATRAKQAHNAVLREYEDLRRENQRVSAEVDAERKEMEARLKKCNTSLSEARTLITSLKAQIKKLTDERNAALATPPPPAPTTSRSKPIDPAKEELKRAKREAAAAEALKQAELEEAAAEAAAQEERARAMEAAAVAAQAAAERIKLAQAKAKKEKAQRRKEAEALAAAQAATAQAALDAIAAPPPHAEEKKPKKKKKDVSPSTEVKEDQPPKMAPPTAQELMKPTPKLSSGYGRCIYEEGEWYEGWWVDYERSGEGTYQWRDGRRYVGLWLHDKKHGAGKYFWVDGDRYEGNYSNDKMHGWGTYFFSDGTKYDGEWENDMSHGKGTFLYSDGAKYVGQFQRDQKHGPGLMHLPSGEIFSEHWINGKRISSVSVKQQQLQPQQQMHLMQQQPPQPVMLQPQPPPPKQQQHQSRNIRQLAQEQLAMSARGPTRR